MKIKSKLFALSRTPNGDTQINDLKLSPECRDNLDNLEPNFLLSLGFSEVTFGTLENGTYHVSHLEGEIDSYFKLPLFKSSAIGFLSFDSLGNVFTDDFGLGCNTEFLKWLAKNPEIILDTVKLFKIGYIRYNGDGAMGIEGDLSVFIALFCDFAKWCEESIKD